MLEKKIFDCRFAKLEVGYDPSFVKEGSLLKFGYLSDYVRGFAIDKIPGHSNILKNRLYSVTFYPNTKSKVYGLLDDLVFESVKFFWDAAKIYKSFNEHYFLKTVLDSDLNGLQNRFGRFAKKFKRVLDYFGEDDIKFLSLYVDDFLVADLENGDLYEFDGERLDYSDFVFAHGRKIYEFLNDV
ncbi:hypothetical protein K9L97_02860 [Candidatus Woesearchaeota archaeon]|nr:hypothetical protein [Candidatus Woesearchaeota archaeon]